jgi:hypothetical protein
VSGALKREMASDRRRNAVAYAVALVVLAAFPKLAYPRRWRPPLSPRRVVASIAFNTAMGFALHVWVLPYLRRMEQKGVQAKEELRQQLGRKPTDAELLAHLGIGRTPRPAGP